MNINELLTGTESKTLEFKQDLSSSKGILRTIVAFANTAGGTLIIGVEDKTKYICGVKEPLLLEEKLSNLVNDCITPLLLPEIDVISFRDTYLIAVQVYPSSTRPHYLKKHGLEKGCYIRIGSTDRLVDAIILNELQRVKIQDSFDKTPIPTLSSEEIDFSVISELFMPEKKIKKIDLETMDLVVTHQKKKVPTAGGVILFGENRLKHFPDAWIQAGRFQGINKTHILDAQEITAYPIFAIDEVINFVKKHSMHQIITPGISSKNKSLSSNKSQWGIPLAAIRELIINAVVHADYAQQGAPIRLAIFDDRIEIENPGLLPLGLTIEDIKQGLSKLRNRVIGQVFYRLGLIERWGSGIQRVMDTCKEAGFPEPMFEEVGTHFRVTIFTNIVHKSNLHPVDMLILSALKKTRGLSTKEIANIIDKSERATRTRLIHLIEKGFVAEISRSLNDPKRKYVYTHHE
jgi:ATP-dependent DNA helicase RecG